MTQVEFGHLATLPDGENMFLTGVTDMVIASTAGGPVLYTVSRLEGGNVQAYRIEADGALSLLDSQGMPGDTKAGAINRLEVMQTDTGQQLMVTGANGTGLYKIDIASNGMLSGPAGVAGDAMPVGLSACQTLTVNGQTYLYSITRGSDHISVWQLGTDGTVSSIQGGAAGDMGSVGLTGLVAAEVDGAPILLAASGADNGLISYRLTDAGHPQEVAQISADQGVGIANPSQVVMVEVGGHSFAVLAASGSSTLSVAEIDSTGQMTLTDHVLDTLNTRFAGVHVMETVTHEGRGYLAVAGADDGVSLFEMLVDGRLHHLGSVADALDTTLDAVSALSLSVQGNTLHLVAASGAEAGLSVFTVDVGPVSAPREGGSGADTLNGGADWDMLHGGAGDDHLSGGGGTDVLIDGAGKDTLNGGAGADVFILTGDGTADVIQDFDISQDTIDLSGWAFMRSVRQLQYTELSNGIVLQFGDEILTVLSANGSPLSWGEIETLDLIGQSRFLPSWVLPEEPDSEPQPVPDPDSREEAPPASSLTLTGTASADTLTGSNGQDTLRGLDQDDQLSGKGGNDQLIGDSGDDQLMGNAGNDRMEGGFGADGLWGGIGFDTIQGNAGDDSLWGNDGFDVLEGGSGNDMLSGNNGADVLHGGDGNDQLTGGLNSDTLWGGDGDDELEGSAGSDQLMGGEGKDKLSGNSGADLLNGQQGNDTLLGGLNNDTLLGDEGNDRLAGGNGRDELFGGAGNDLLTGNAGHDTLDGGAGDDFLSGGIGADSFIFSAGQDQIADFQNNIDTLILDTALWGGGTLSLAELGQFASLTDKGFVALDFGGGNKLELTGVETLDVLKGDLDFI